MPFNNHILKSWGCKKNTANSMIGQERLVKKKYN